MKRTLRKGIVLTLIMCLFVSMQSSVIYAATAKDKVEATTNSWYTNEELLNCLGLVGAEPVDKGKVKTLSAGISKSTYINERGTEITIVENTPDRVELRFQNGEEVNTLAFTKEGKTYMCGKDVTSYDENGNPEDLALFVAPKAGYSTYYKNTCPYGSASDYTHNYGTEQNKNMPLSNKISDILVETFISWLCGKLLVGGSEAESLFKNLYYALKQTNPQTTALSYKATLWSHKNYTSGYIPSLFTFVWKYQVKLYPQTNFGGAAQIRNTYKCKLTV